MIWKYANGASFMRNCARYLEKDREFNSFFFIDAPLLVMPDRDNFALRVTEDGKRLFVLRAEPYQMLLYGSADCVPTLAKHLHKRGCVPDAWLTSPEVGDKLCAEMAALTGREWKVSLAMEYLETDKITGPSSDEVETAAVDDADEIFRCMQNFVTDCGLHDVVKKENIEKDIASYRLIRRNGEIASLARYGWFRETADKINSVYTKDGYRGQGLARRVVNTIKNEIISSGRKACLFVDRKNPISNSLYRSLGFEPVFLQSEYRLSDQENT